MIRIDDLKEKELLIAYYFASNPKKEVKPSSVYNMWCNWFKQDFWINNKPLFRIANRELVFRKNANKVVEENVLDKYRHTFQCIYGWIKKLLYDDTHDKEYLKQELDRERNKEYGKVVSLAKTLRVYVYMKTSYKNLSEFTLTDFNDRKHVLARGSCAKMIEYLEGMKKSE